jgi:YjgF/chorismate_mutase-like, putative endoribonuclease
MRFFAMEGAPFPWESSRSRPGDSTGIRLWRNEIKGYGGRLADDELLVTADERVAALGLEIPEIPELPFRPKLRPVLVHGGLAYLSGIGPIGVSGRVGEDMSVEDGYAAARTTALLALRRILDELGSLEAVDRWVKVLGLVRSAPGFGDQPAVVNGFSDLVVEVYGEERGLCARSAIGVAELPAGMPVEVEATVALA